MFAMAISTSSGLLLTNFKWYYYYRWRMSNKLKILLVTVMLFELILSANTMGFSEMQDQDLLDGSYAYEQDGWLIVHLEGSPYQIGYQNGYLTAEKANYWLLSYLGGQEDRQIAREIAQEFVWDKIPAEYRKQLEGIEASLQARGYDWDIWDVVACNQWADQDAFQSSQKEPEEPEGCSAFIATGDATTTGEIVIGHNTWYPYEKDFMYNVIYDVRPENGYGYRYQSAGGSIWSGQEWYMNEAGLVITLTSIGWQPMDPEGNLHFTTRLHAIQYCDGIDGWIETVTEKNNGGGQAECLIGDTKTGEIASLQLLTTDWEFHRTFNGFFGSSNYLWSESLRELTGAGDPDPANRGYARYIRWGQLEDEYYGKIDVEVGKLMLSDHYDTYLGIEAPSSRTICGHGEAETVTGATTSGAYDCKVTSSTLALDGMSTWARWGHPCGTPFDADAFLEANPEWAQEHGEQAVEFLHLYKQPNPWTFIEKSAAGRD